MTSIPLKLVCTKGQLFMCRLPDEIVCGATGRSDLSVFRPPVARVQVRFCRMLNENNFRLDVTIFIHLFLNNLKSNIHVQMKNQRLV